MVIVPDPPRVFAPAVDMLASGTALYRVHGNARGPAEFNGSGQGSTRFAFFGDPVVPVMYAAETESAAVAETLLHDVLVSGGVIPASSYRSRVLNRIVSNRPLRLVQFHGLGLRRLRIEATQLTDTTRSEYHRTVQWAEAAHAFHDQDGPLDGIAWMSKRCNSDRAYVFFGDRVSESDFDVDPSFGRVFADTDDIAWLSDLCAPLGVDVMHA